MAFSIFLFGQINRRQRRVGSVNLVRSNSFKRAFHKWFERSSSRERRRRAESGAIWRLPPNDPRFWNKFFRSFTGPLQLGRLFIDARGCRRHKQILFCWIWIDPLEVFVLVQVCFHGVAERSHRWHESRCRDSNERSGESLFATRCLWRPIPYSVPRYCENR